MDKDVLIGVVEFKSQVGSLGNNFNNRCEEALGSATDFSTALRKNILKLEIKLFLGYLMLVEDSLASRSAVQNDSHHFEIDQIFENTSYLERYAILCERMIREGLYDTATLLASSPEDGLKNGDYADFGKLISLKIFVSNLAGAIAAHKASR